MFLEHINELVIVVKMNYLMLLASQKCPNKIESLNVVLKITRIHVV